MWLIFKIAQQMSNFTQIKLYEAYWSVHNILWALA